MAARLLLGSTPVGVHAFALAVCLLAGASCSRALRPRPPPRPLLHSPQPQLLPPALAISKGERSLRARPGTQNCTVHYMAQRLDHFEQRSAPKCKSCSTSKPFLSFSPRSALPLF